MSPYLPSVRWHATKWFGSISRSTGSSLLQRSVAYGQRAAKRQPGFGLIGEVISPFKMIRSLFFFRLGTGIAESRACVYGWVGLSKRIRRHLYAPAGIWRGYTVLNDRLICTAIGTADRIDAVYAVQGCESGFFCKYNKFDREMILR